jgi:hypothetical protein
MENRQLRKRSEVMTKPLYRDAAHFCIGLAIRGLSSRLLELLTNRPRPRSSM